MRQTDGLTPGSSPKGEGSELQTAEALFGQRISAGVFL